MNDPKTYKNHLYVFDYIRLNKYTIPNDLPQLNFHELCSQNSRNAFMYAYNILKRSFPLGEPVISQNAQYACSYARYVLHRRFELGEPAIATSAVYSYDYAYAFDRFELGEPAIAKTPSYSYWYAEHVLYGPFPEGEHVIAKSSYSYLYTKSILKHDFYLDGKLICKHEE